MYFDNEWLLNFEMTAGVRLRALFEKDLDAMPLEIADGLRRLREAEEKAVIYKILLIQKYLNLQFLLSREENEIQSVVQAREGAETAVWDE